MTPPAPDRRPEIIVVRRKSRTDDGHHGGAWKIAFADFMTAMMALFLVLWLVNAANEETKKSVASYFNPVKLVDRNRSERGLSEADGPSKKLDEKNDKAQSEDEGSAAAVEEEAERRNAAFFARPMEALDEIAREEEAAREMIAGTGENYPSDTIRDPFASIFWSASDVVEQPVPDQETTEKPPVPVTEPEPASSDLQQELAEAVAERAGNDAAGPERFTVEETGEGTLISLLDTGAAPMFSAGSAVPEGGIVLALEAVAAVLAGKPGVLRIHGHTDATPFQPGSAMDNWRLSTDRAHAARLMLLRGGIEEARVAAVSGHASSRPLIAEDRSSPANRRVEILLVSDTQ